MTTGSVIFPGGKASKPLSNMPLPKMLERMGCDEITVQGFRSSFSDYAIEQTNASYEVREVALAHVVTSKVERAYRRSDLFDQRRDLMARWANHIAGVTADVVPMERRRA